MSGQRRCSQQWRLIAAVCVGGASTAEIERIRSHEIGRRHGHMRRREMLEQADANVVDVIVIHGVVITSHCRCRHGRVHQRVQVQYIRLRRAQLGAHFLVVYARLFEIVNEVATRTVRAKADRVEGAAQLGLVLGMACEVAQFPVAVCKLALVAIFARAILFVWPAKFGFIARCRFADTAV